MLTKYRVEPESASGGAALTQLWSVKEDDLMYGVAESESGLIFLCGLENKAIYIYSGEGAYVRFLQHSIFRIGEYRKHQFIFTSELLNFQITSFRNITLKNINLKNVSCQ